VIAPDRQIVFDRAVGNDEAATERPLDDPGDAGRRW